MIIKIKLFLKQQTDHLKKFSGQTWYPLLIGLLSFLDVFLIIVPSDSILLSSTLLNPKRWLTFAIYMTIGSTLGLLILVLILEYNGIESILNYYPALKNSTSWLWTQKFFGAYGLILVFVIAATPLAQQPSVILAVLAGISTLPLITVIFLGRLLKFVLISYVAVKAPKYIEKFLKH